MTKISVLGIITATLLTAAAPALAQEPTSRPTGARCQIVANRIGTRLESIKQRKENHVAVFRRTADRIAAIADKLAAKGVDVTQLKADIATLRAKVDAIETGFADLVAKTEELKNMICTSDRPTVKAKAQEVRDQFKAVRNAVSDARKYFREVIVVEIKALRSQVAKPTAAVNAQ